MLIKRSHTPDAFLGRFISRWYQGGVRIKKVDFSFQTSYGARVCKLVEEWRVDGDSRSRVCGCLLLFCGLLTTSVFRYTAQ